MADWAGHEGRPTASWYRDMAERSLRGVSPSYERICLGVAGDPELITRLDALPAPKRQPNLLLGVVRFLSGPVDSYPAFRAFVLGRWDEVAATMLARRTQTNEPRRCATLLPVLAALPRPLALLEVGASAGLCLLPDRYAYRYNDGAPPADEGVAVGGPPNGESGVPPSSEAVGAGGVGASELVLGCRADGPVPVPDRLPEVAWRAGLDLFPLDVRDDEDVRWLRCLIWPEETHRFPAFDAAVAIARADPPAVHRGDLLTDLASLAAQAPAEATLVVYHSAVLAYLSEPQRFSFRAEITRLVADRPTVWLSNEGSGVVVDHPAAAGRDCFVLARDGVPLALTGGHGDWISWLPN